MLSGFGRRRRVIATSTPRLDETYNLRGLNMVAPDQIMPDGESPYNLNSRGYARDDGQSRVAIRNRKGSTLLSTPVGETVDATNTGTVTDDLSFDKDTWVDILVTAGADGALSKIDSYIKKNASGNGPVIIEVYSDNSGALGDLLATTSILPSSVTTSYADVSSHVMDAPTIANGDDYHLLYKVQDAGSGSYYLGLTSGSGVRTTADGGSSWTTVSSSARFKLYLSTEMEIIGFARRYPQASGGQRTYFAATDGNVYEVTDAGTPTSIDSAVNVNASYWRTAQIDDKLMWVDGYTAAKWYDGSSVTSIANTPSAPSHVWVHKNRAFFVPSADRNKVVFSDLYDFESYPSVNFFYVPNPKSPDHITAGVTFQDSLVIFTHETKHTVFGSDISTFTRKEAIGTKGAVSQEAVAVDRNYIYFMADDKMIYRYNGVSDQIISEKIRPLLSQVQDPKKVRLHIHDNQLRVYYAATPSTTPTEMAIFDIDQSGTNPKDFTWFHDSGRSAVGSLTWYLDDNELIEFSSRIGAIYTGESGLSDAGKPISFKYWTAYKTYGSGAAKDRIKRFRPIVRPAAVPYYLSVGKDVNFANKPDMRDWLVDSGGALWGNFQWNDGTKWGAGSNLVDNTSPMSGRGKHTQYRFEKEAVDVEIELYGYIALVKSGRPR
ncbi:hypothetical protein KDA23_05655 [Candidatus Saccharibacteria bacterium]|nr:hypothetical protein [Candidatus Saccharibacteria bacterium]